MIAVFDLDGTLSNDKWRRHRIKKGWDEYHLMLSADNPMNAHLTEKHIDAGDRIVIVTARPEKYRSATTEWLNKHLLGQAGQYQLLMRPEGNQMSSPELKIQLLYSAGIAAPDVGIAYDDRADVLAELSRWGVQTTVLIGAEENPADNLRKMAETFDQRSKVYGKNYLVFGKVCAELWPEGLILKTKEDWARMGVLTQVIAKLTRYTNNPSGHKDSAHDIGPYAAILEALTNED